MVVVDTDVVVVVSSVVVVVSGRVVVEGLFCGTGLVVVVWWKMSPGPVIVRSVSILSPVKSGIKLAANEPLIESPGNSVSPAARFGTSP